MHCINSSFNSDCFIEEPCAGKPQARFCGGYHSIETNFNLNNGVNVMVSTRLDKIILGAQATKKFVEIEEVASLAYYLCSKEAASITGTSLSMDGGWTSQ